MTRDPRRYNIYVIELDSAVLEGDTFREANPDYIEGKPCVYVGMTSLTPEARFDQHSAGTKSSRRVKKYGMRLRPKLYDRHNPMTYEDACEMEVEKARRLRNKGYGVWQK